MDLNTLKERLHSYIDTADEEHLAALFQLLKDQIADNARDELFIQELRKRRENHFNGISKSYSVEEFLKLIRQHRQ